MTHELDEFGYHQTRAKLEGMQRRLKALDERRDVSPEHRDATRRSYLEMMKQYTRDIELYEAKHRHSHDENARASQ